MLHMRIFTHTHIIDINSSVSFLFMNSCVEPKLIILRNGRTLETSLDVDRLRTYGMRKNDFRKNFSSAFIRHVRYSIR